MVHKIPESLYKEILKNIPICCVDLVIQSEKGVLLVYRKNEPAKNTWWLPGGRIIKNEKMEDAVLRKAFEETGLKVQIKNKIGVYETLFDKNPFNDPSFGAHSVNICFLVEALNQEVKLDNQSSEFRWINEIENNLPDYVKKVINDSKVFC